MARTTKASSEAKTTLKVNTTVVDNTDIILDDQALLDLIGSNSTGTFATFAKEFITKDQVVTGVITSARIKLVEDKMATLYDGKKNPKYGCKELHIEIIVDNNGIDTIIDKKLCYAMDLKNGLQEAIDQYHNRISNVVIGLSKQYGVKASEFVMSLYDFCNRITDGKTEVTIAKVPFGIKKTLNGEVPMGYVLEFDKDKIQKLIDDRKESKNE